MESVGEPALACTMRAHRGEVACADASGAWLATGGGDGTLRLWRWRRGEGWAEAESVPRAHRYGVTAARWAAGGVLLASVGVDGAARLWAARSLAARGELVAPHAAAARSACWATSERLLVGHDDGAVRVWRVRGPALLACVNAHEGSVHALSAFGDAALLLTACTEGVLKIFSLNEVCNSGTEGSSVPIPLVWEDGAHDLGASCADASSCGRMVATGGQDARVRVWSAPGRVQGGVPGGVTGGVLSGHSAGVTAVRWARGDALLASASLDRTARLWAIGSRTCLRVFHAHSRYLTCVVVPQHARYIITGSNDKTVRTWSLSSFSIDNDVEPECSPLVHFGLGDLEGIGPVDEEELLEGEESPETSAGVRGAACVWRAREHAGAVNCLAAHGDALATACSDGMVRIFRWSEECGALRLERALEGHQYPALAVDFGAGGALLSAGLDGRACLWDVQSGCELVSLWAAGAAAAGGGEGEGGGGVRGARLSPHRPPLLLLATDDGVAALWAIDGDGTDPVHVYPVATEACTCCAWSGDGRAAAAGGAGGELRVLAPPPAARVLWLEPAAHDLGVLSCDFSADVEETDEEREYLLASGGMDEVVKLWVVTCDLGGDAMVKLGGTLAAHGGAVQSVRWGSKGTLATAGSDRWARVWRISKDETGNVKGVQLAAVSAGGAGGSPTAAFLRPSLLAVGSLNGRLALWHVPDVNDTETEDDECVEPRWWREAGVVRWLTEYVTRTPGSLFTPEDEAKLIEIVHERGICGANILDEPLENILDYFGYNTNYEVSDDNKNEEDNDQEDIEIECVDGGEDKDKEVKREAERQMAERLREELEWLRRPPLTYEEEVGVPHALRCTLSHTVPRWPVRASDGYTYELAALAHWRAAMGDVSPISGRRLRGAVAPNYGVLRALREHLAKQGEDDLLLDLR